jgi:hypothetical protein
MERECGGKRKNGQKCHAPAIRGGTACWRHTPNPKARAMAVVRDEVTRWGLGDSTIDPADALLRLLSQSVARAERYAIELEQHVGESATLREALIAQAYGEFGPVGDYIRGLVVLEAQERDRAANFAIKAIAAGIAERQVRVAEAQASIAERALMAALDDLGLSVEQRREASARLVHHLRAVG